MWTKMMGGPRKKAPKTIAVIDPDSCFGAFACSICQAACPVAGCIVEEPDRDGRMVCAVRADLCIGCGLCVTLGNPTAPQQREFGCPADYDAINMMPFEEVVKLLQEPAAAPAAATVARSLHWRWASRSPRRELTLTPALGLPFLAQVWPRALPHSPGRRLPAHIGTAADARSATR